MQKIKASEINFLFGAGKLLANEQLMVAKFTLYFAWRKVKLLN